SGQHESKSGRASDGSTPRARRKMGHGWDSWRIDPPESRARRPKHRTVDGDSGRHTDFTQMHGARRTVMTMPHIFDSDVVAAILRHMNGDHSDDNLLIARAFGAASDLP